MDNNEFFNKVQEERKNMDSYTTDWQQVRIQASIAAMQGLLSNEKQVHIKVSEAAYMSVLYADALVKELKENRTMNEETKTERL